MRILLPPSEGKTPPESGHPLRLGDLSFPALTAARSRVLQELVRVSGRSDAAAILGVGERVMPEVRAQRRLAELPCAPAREIYTGVLYEAARLHEGDDVLIFSGLFGVTTGDDLIPDYRLSMNVSLSDVGGLRSWWRRELAAAVREEDSDVTVDMRSGAYRITSPTGPWWDMRVVDGRGRVVTHMAKRYRGLLTRALLDARVNRRIADDDVAQITRTLGRVEVACDGLRRHLTLTPDAG
jgi:cytoplasmic iron level regulating protein YaaA (DUF328/UPF0246 family)